MRAVQEIDELCDAWQPEPLVSTEDLKKVVKRKERVVTRQSGSRVTIDGKVRVAGGRACVQSGRSKLVCARPLPGLLAPAIPTIPTISMTMPAKTVTENIETGEELRNKVTSDFAIIKLDHLRAKR